MSEKLVTLRALIVVVVIGATLSSGQCAADQPANIPRIGVLAAPYANAPANEGLRDGLRELGYIEDESIAVERRSAGTQEELRSAATDLVRQKVNVIVVFSTPAARVALDATTVPVVFLVGDPVSTGLAASLARPAGNATGVSLIYTELNTKRLEILQQLVPRAQRIGCLINSSNPASVLQFEAARRPHEVSTCNWSNSMRAMRPRLMRPFSRSRRVQWMGYSLPAISFSLRTTPNLPV